MNEPSPQQVQAKRVPGTAVGDPGASSFASHTPISRTRFILAFLVAVASDIVSFVTEIVPPMQLVIDGATALLLFLLLGRNWLILPGLIAEAIPGIAAFPFWIVVVLAIFATDRKRRRSGAGVGRG